MGSTCDDSMKSGENSLCEADLVPQKVRDMQKYSELFLAQQNGLINDVLSCAFDKESVLHCWAFHLQQHAYALNIHS